MAFKISGNVDVQMFTKIIVIEAKLNKNDFYFGILKLDLPESNESFLTGSFTAR